MSYPRPKSAPSRDSDAQATPGIPSRLPQEFLDDGPLREISIEQWTSIFKRMEVDGIHTEDDVIRFLTAPGLTMVWLDLLQVIHDLGTEAGVEALLEAAAEIGMPCTDWPTHAREVATEIWVRSQKDPGRQAYERLLLLATIVLHERRPSGVDRLYAGKQSIPSKTGHRKAANLLETRLCPWFERNRLGDYVEVKFRPEEADFSLCIQHGGHAVARRVIRGRSQETLRFQPAQTDVIRYESLTGRLRVMASTERLSEEYRRAVGAVMFEDEDFFTGAVICNLKPLLNLLREGQQLPTPSPRRGILAVRLLNCLWTQEHGLGMRIYGERTNDCIGRIRRSGLHVEEGQLNDARLEFAFRGRQGTERVRANIRVPGHVHVRKPTRREAIDGYLSDIGILNQGKSTASPERVDLWTLGDTAHVLPRWRSVCGDDTREAIRIGLLREHPLQAVTHDGQAIPVVQVESHDRVDHVLVPDDGTIGPIGMVDPEELVGYRLDDAVLAHLLATELGCQRSPAQIFPGCFDLGPLEMGRARVRPFLLTRSPAGPEGDLLATLQAFAQSAHVVAIVPPSRTLDPAIRTIFLGRILPPFEHLRPEIVDVLGIAAQVPVLDRAPRSARVVIDRANRTAWLDRTEITPLSDQLWELLVLLADLQEQGKSLSSDKVNRSLSGTAEGVALRRTSDAKRYLFECIEKVFTKKKVPVPTDLKEMISAAGGACRLAFRAYAP
jgi:hypothetical protein